MSAGDRPLQSHGLTSAVYVPILRHIFTEKYLAGDTVLEFTLDDVRVAAATLGLTVRNPADVIYRMRSRTMLPAEILEAGFYILRQVGRGRYRFEVGKSTIVPIPANAVIDALDLTPLPVRRLLPEDAAKFDEQALLTVVNYCSLLDHFTGLKTYRLRSHVRKSVVGVGQAELDELDVAVALTEEEEPVILPIEAKASSDAINRVQISAMAAFCAANFPAQLLRPIAVKVDYDSLIHIIEFNVTTEPAELMIEKSATYRLRLSEQQRHFIEKTRAALL